MKCQVFNCTNNDRDKTKPLGFFKFPKEPDLLAKWHQFCRAQGKFKPKTWAVCSDHFNYDEVEGLLQVKLGIPRHLRLRPGSVPSIYTSPVEEFETCEQIDDIEYNIPKDEDVIEGTYIEIDRVRAEDLDSNDVATLSDVPPGFDEVMIEVVEDEPPSSIVTRCQREKFDEYLELALEIQRLRREVKSIKRENVELQNQLKKQENEKNKLKRTIAKITEEKEKTERLLGAAFTEGQRKRLMTGSDKVHWRKDDFTRAQTLYEASPKAYKLLKRSTFPLPGVRTLQRWINKNKEMEH